MISSVYCHYCQTSLIRQSYPRINRPDAHNMLLNDTNHADVTITSLSRHSYVIVVITTTITSHHITGDQVYQQQQVVRSEQHMSVTRNAVSSSVAALNREGGYYLIWAYQCIHNIFIPICIHLILSSRESQPKCIVI